MNDSVPTILKTNQIIRENIQISEHFMNPGGSLETSRDIVEPPLGSMIKWVERGQRFQ